MATSLGEYMIPAYLAGEHLDSKAMGDSNFAALFVARVAKPVGIGIRAIEGAVLTLPNGYKYAVNQSYDAPTVIGRMSIQTTLFSKMPGRTAADTAGSIAFFTSRWFDAVGQQHDLYGKFPNSGQYLKITGFFHGVSVDSRDGHAGAIADVTIDFEPLESSFTWTSTVP